MWAAVEFCNGLQAFHGRNRTSLSKAAELIIKQSGTSFSKALGNSFRQAVAGIFSKSTMDPAQMLAGHIAATVKRLDNSASEWLLVAQDTTYYNFSTHKQLSGLGAIQGNLKGVLQHSVLAMDANGLPLGLLHQQNWTRQGLNAPEKESEKWFTGLEAVNTSLSGLAKKVMLIQDREADIFRFFQAVRSANVELLVRIHQARQVEVSCSGQTLALQQAVYELPALGQLQTEIYRNNQPVRLCLQVSGGQVAILPDKDLSAAKHKATDLYLVFAQERDCLDEQGESVFDARQAAEWILLTTYPIQTPEQALQAVHWYALRWRIERLHLVLKSAGMQVEKRRFDDVHTLFNALAFYSIIAWRALYLTYLVRQQPELPAREIFNPPELQLLQAKAKKPVETLQQAVKSLGLLINFQPTKRQPLPGVKLLLQALIKLNHMCEAIALWQNISLQD
jgi:hypothetical protein